MKTLHLKFAGANAGRQHANERLHQGTALQAIELQSDK